MDNDQQNSEEASSCTFFNISREAFPALICSCTACLASLSEQASAASATVSLFSGSEENTTSVYPQSSTTDNFDTQSESFFSDYIQDSLYEYTQADNVFAAQNEMIKPFELTTRANTKDLQIAIVEIWCRSGLNNNSRRLLYMAWYNWVMLDIARRLNELYRRNNGYRLVNELKQELSRRNHSDSDLDQHPLFNVSRRTRLVYLANNFGDSICALSEFTDFMQVMEMSDLEFDHLYVDLLKRRDELSDRLNTVSGFFISNRPMGYSSPRTS
ncbi:hypothetical protein BCV71DRAFT_275587 [Rhizopus microsporus]|uniref:Uncharacterized protein n=1 Tax=Rhizopus microsporus TaxID=58291 RepID=A0A1X0RRP3_RHIZD|nr:hypothetical protein BCV71DRAFT_275587 [Rhizopus microsporus]